MPSSNTHKRPGHRHGSDTTSEFRITWRHAGLGAFLSLLGVYVTLIVGGLAFTGWQSSRWPTQLNSVIMICLAIGVISFVVLVVGDSIRQAVREEADEEEEEDTAPMGFRPRPWPVGAGVYLSKMATDGQVAYAVPRVTPSPRSAGDWGDVGVRVEAVIDRAAAQLVERFEEYGGQQYFRGYAACAEDRAGGTVTALPPRNGNRSTS